LCNVKLFFEIEQMKYIFFSR